MWCTFLLGLIGALSLSFTYFFYQILSFDGRPHISNSFCWSQEENCKNDTNIYPFKIDVKKQDIDDLIARLSYPREFTPPLEDTQTQYGLNGRVLEPIIKYIKEEYNFTERQIFINKYPQFTTTIQGVKIHFIHIKSKNGPKFPTIPLLLLHGWPSSVLEYYEAIPKFLSQDRQYALELVIPSLVGFGYSEGATKPNFRAAHMANMMNVLMERLGYKHYLVHGSDWGAVVATNLATLYPQKLIGFHSTFCVSLRVVTFLKMFLGALYPPFVIEKKFEEKLYPLSEFVRWLMAEAGYFHLMGSKPDTIGHALDHSPVGLISYLFEKVSVGKNKNDIYSETAALETFDTRRILDIILFYYWFPKKATTSARIYCENTSVRGLLEGLHNTPIDREVPCACTFYENDFLYMPENFLRDKYTNIIHYDVIPDIGHFAAIEDSDVFTKDIVSFIDKLFDNNINNVKFGM